jgi:aspartate ammonia-lyase
MAVMGHDHIIVQAVSGGNLELSQFLPLVADSLLTALDLMTAACDIFARHCVAGMVAICDRCLRQVHNSTATITALVDHLGHHVADELVKIAHNGPKSLRQLVLDRGLMTEEEFNQLVSAQRAMQLGSPTAGAPQQRSHWGKRE